MKKGLKMIKIWLKICVTSLYWESVKKDFIDITLTYQRKSSRFYHKDTCKPDKQLENNTTRTTVVILRKSFIWCHMRKMNFLKKDQKIQHQNFYKNHSISNLSFKMMMKFQESIEILIYIKRLKTLFITI